MPWSAWWLRQARSLAGTAEDILGSILFAEAPGDSATG